MTAPITDKQFVAGLSDLVLYYKKPEIFVAVAKEMFGPHMQTDDQSQAFIFFNLWQKTNALVDATSQLFPENFVKDLDDRQALNYATVWLPGHDEPFSDVPLKKLPERCETYFSQGGIYRDHYENIVLAMTLLSEELGHSSEVARDENGTASLDKRLQRIRPHLEEPLGEIIALGTIDDLDVDSLIIALPRIDRSHSEIRQSEIKQIVSPEATIARMLSRVKEDNYQRFVRS